MSEDLQRRKEGESEKAAEDAIDRRRDAEATSDDFEGHRHVAQTTDRSVDKSVDKASDV